MNHSISVPFRIPKYSTYLDTAYAMGMIAGNFDIRNELCVSYVNLAAPSALSEQSMPLYVIPWNDLHRFVELGYLLKEQPSFNIATADNELILKCITDALESNCYVYANVNEEHLPGTGAHAREIPSTHPCLINACDFLQQKFTVYTYRKDGLFGPTYPSFSEVVMAIKDRGDPKKNRDIYYREPLIFFFKKNPCFKAVPFNKETIKTVFCEYVDSLPSSYRPTETMSYGHSAVAYFLERTLNWVQSGHSIDLRGTRALMEHRNIMTGNIEFLIEKMRLPCGLAIKDGYREVTTWAQKFHLLCFAVDMREENHERNIYLLLEHLSHANEIQRKDLEIMRILSKALGMF